MILVFTGFLTGQIVFDYLSLDAEPQSVEITRLNAYSDYFSEHFKEENAPNNQLTLVTFWASWCAPCLQEMKVLKNIQSTFGKENLKILAINGDEIDQLQKIEKVKKEIGFDFEVIKDESGFYFDKFNVAALPFTILFKGDRAVRVLDTAVILDINSFETYLSTLI